MTDWLQIFLDVENKKPILVNLQELIKSRALLQANSGGGKSHVMRKGIEEAHGKVQQIIIDPEGEFHTLREKYSFLLVGTGPQTDIQIDSKHAALLARRIMETGADVIIDLYELNPFERIRFVKLFCETLVNLPKTLWHQCLIWLDEIHVFAPESKSGRSESLAAVAALASRGRKRGYGLIGATQRISKLSKDVAAELNTKFIGRCALDIDRKRAGEELGIKDTTVLRKLQHEFYAFGPAICDDNVLVKAYSTVTTHEEIGTIKNYAPANKGKIQGLLKNFTELPQEAELDLKTIKGLQLKIHELQTNLKQSENNQPKQDSQVIEKSYQKGIRDPEIRFREQFKAVEIYQKRLTVRVKEILEHSDKISQAANTIDALDFKINQTNIGENNQVSEIVSEKIVSKSTQQESDSLKTIIENNDNIKLGRCEESCLKALAQRGKECSRLQIATIAGYSSKSGGFNNAISKLKTFQFITVNGIISITQVGLNYLGSNYERIDDTPEELLKLWKSKLPKCPASILQYLYDIHPSYAPKTNIADETNYSIGSGGFNNGISKLNSLGLVEKSSEGFLRITDEVMYS